MLITLLGIHRTHRFLCAGYLISVMSMSIKIFSVAKIAELLRSPQRRGRVTVRAADTEST